MTTLDRDPSVTSVDDTRYRGIARPWRRVALVVAVARYVISLLGALVFPFLLFANVVVLVLMRPNKEFLLWGGGRSRLLGEPEVITLFLAFLPLGLLAIPAFFVVGRAYGWRLREGDGPSWLTRVLPPHHLELGQRVLPRRGPAIAILGRFAAMPPTVLAAAAGVSDVPWRAYLAADAVGAVLATSVTIGIGYTLGRTASEGRIWLTVIGVVMFGVVIGLFTYWLRREANRPDAPTADDPHGERATV